MSEFVGSELRSGIGYLQLQRAPANAIEIESARQLGDELEVLERADEVKAIILTGTGKFFSAGLDLKLVPTYDRAEQRSMVRELARAILGLYASRKPVIAAINGHAVAAGTLFALCCDYRIGTTNGARFGLTGARVGVPYPVAALEVIRAELGVTGSRLALLGATTFDSAEARKRGILDEEVTDARVLARATEVAADRATLPAKYYGDLKHQLRAASIVRIRESLTTDPALEGWIVET